VEGILAWSPENHACEIPDSKTQDARYQMPEVVDQLAGWVEERAFLKA